MAKSERNQGGLTGRRGFLLGGGAFLMAAGSARTLFGAEKNLRLRFGVLSDIHITMSPNSCRNFEKALRYFRKNHVDAVLIAGDLADNGLVSELLRMGETWRRVFPGNRGENGSSVEKIFVTGNHDLDGWQYGNAKKQGVTREKDENNLIEFRLADAWRKAFDEEYAPMFVKTVKGYSFVGIQYERKDGYLKPGAIAAFLRKHRSALAGEKPFFYTQHFHPRGTCSAPWVWGQDAGHSTQALSDFPNAVAFSGHSHTPLTDDRTLWRGEFTSVGTASLRYLFPFGGRENSYICGEPPDWCAQQMPVGPRGAMYQGQVVSVYDDAMVLERIDFANELPAAPDWVVPLPAVACSFEERAKKAAVPEFPDGAAVAVKRITGKSRDGKTTVQFAVSFPNIRPGLKDARPFDYRVDVEVMDVDRSGSGITKRIYSPHFGWAAEKDDPVVTCVFAASELPKANRVPDIRGRRFRFAVSPANSFGAHGAPIRSEWMANVREDRQKKPEQSKKA